MQVQIRKMKKSNLDTQLIKQKAQKEIEKLSKQLQKTVNRINRIFGEYCKIPILGFNSGKYDVNLFIKHMVNPQRPITDLITRNKSILKFDWGSYTFLDVRNYLPPNINLERFGKMFKLDVAKEIFPYEWFNNIEKLNEQSLPPIKAFINRLKNEECRKEDYERALQEWEKQGFTTFQDYLMFYCTRDVEVLLKGLELYKKFYRLLGNLEMLNEVSISSCAWNVALRAFMSPHYPLYKIPTKEMYSLIMESIQGGRCEVFIQHITKTPNSIIVGLDENNLYGHSLQRCLPYGQFTFLPFQAIPPKLTRDTTEFKKEENVVNLSSTFIEVSREQTQKPYEERHSTKTIYDNDYDVQKQDPYKFTGFIRCALYYTPEQIERTRHFPLLPTKLTPANEFLQSPYMKEIQKGLINYNRKENQNKGNLKFLKNEKVIYFVFPLPNYCIFSEALKYLLENNLVCLERIYEAIKTPLGPVMRNFINSMTQIRQQAAEEKDDSKKELAKLCNNSVFGKTIQNEEKFTDNRLFNNDKDFLNICQGRTIVDFNIISAKNSNHNGLVEVKLKNKKYNIRTPKYIGATALWYSKMLMWDFVYNVL
jgi:hypothetical protein